MRTLRTRSASMTGPLFGRPPSPGVSAPSPSGPAGRASRCDPVPPLSRIHERHVEWSACTRRCRYATAMEYPREPSGPAVAAQAGAVLFLRLPRIHEHHVEWSACTRRYRCAAAMEYPQEPLLDSRTGTIIGTAEWLCRARGSCPACTDSQTRFTIPKPRSGIASEDARAVAMETGR